MGRKFLTLLCVLGTLSPNYAVNEMGATEQMQCSESWCNQSLTCSETYSCPPGLLCKDGLCECPDQYPHNIIVCDSIVGLSLLSGYCVTFDEINRALVVGYCIFSSVFPYTSLYTTFPMREEENTLCKSYNRTGALCGRCQPDHYPLAYSFDVTCIPCPHARWNWFRYIMAAYLPLTVFFLCILFLKVNTTSSHLFAVVYLCQLLSMPIMGQIIFVIVNHNALYRWGAKLLASLYMIWNLDFFKPFYSDLCLGIGILPTLALDYVIAVYPLLLMIITYLLIVLYDRHCKVIVVMIRPYQLLLSLFQKRWDVKTSLIHAFSTFFLLSSIKFLSISFTLLSFVQVHHLHGDYYNYTYGLYYAADIEYFGSEHLPYAILAIVVLCVFVIIPITILVLYPFGFFQKFLNLFPVRWYVLHTFMDAFLGCYKDGTEPGTRDCRWFFSFYFIARILLFLIYSLTVFEICVVASLIVLTIHISLLIIFQPYKLAVAHLNVTNIVSLQLIALGLLCYIGSFASLLSLSPTSTFLIMVYVIATIPHICTAAYILYWIYTHRLFGLQVMQRLKAWKNGYALINNAPLS